MLDNILRTCNNALFTVSWWNPQLPVVVTACFSVMECLIL